MEKNVAKPGGAGSVVTWAPAAAAQPAIIFAGEGFERDPALAHAKGLLLDFFRGREVSALSLKVLHLSPPPLPALCCRLSPTARASGVAERSEDFRAGFLPPLFDAYCIETRLLCADKPFLVRSAECVLRFDSVYKMMPQSCVSFHVSMPWLECG